MDFVAWYRRARLPTGGLNERRRGIDSIFEEGASSADSEIEMYGFQKQHPLHKTHGLRKREIRVIPDLVGPRFPDRDNLNTADEREHYGLMALILFFPFQLDCDLTQGTGSYWESFKLFFNSRYMSKHAGEILENFQEYYISKRAAAQERRVLSEIKALYTEEGAINAEKLRDPAEEICDILPIDKAVETVSEWDFRNFVLLKGATETAPGRVGLISNHPNTKTCIDLFAEARSGSSNVGHGKALVNTDMRDVENGFVLDQNNVKKIYKDICSETDDILVTENSNECAQNWSTEECNHGSEEETTLSYLEDTLQELTKGNDCESDESSESSRSASRNARSGCGHFPSIQRVAERFSLNSLQKKAFSLVAKELLWRIAEGYSLPVSLKSKTRKRKKFTMYLGGEGGTGKTRVIEALLHFCKSWNFPKAVRTGAPTGIAASFVHGRTIHSLLGISAGRSFNPKRRLPKNVYELHEDTMLLIIDEVSMLNRKILAAVDAFFRKVKECDVPFGGIMVMFCGDFFQIPPVANDPLYINPNCSRGHIGIQDILGFELWQNLDYAIVLEESMRQCDDEAFGECLSRVRYGKTAAEDLRLINSRVIGPHLLHDLRNAQKNQVPCVVRTNDIRTTINWRMLQARAKALEQKPIICIAQIHSLNGNPISARDMETILNTNDTETGNIAVLLPMISGMPIRITQNVSVELGMANGTEGFLEGVAFHSSASFQDTKLFGLECLVSDQLPRAAFIRSSSFRANMRKRFPNLPSRYSDDTIPILPVKVEDISGALKRKLCGTKKLAFKQMPFVPAYASTTYKVQGSTTDGIVVFPLMKECKVAPPKATLYVVLSRVRKLENLFLIERITEADSKFFVPSKALLAEDKRLLSLHRKTVKLIDKAIEA